MYPRSLQIPKKRALVTFPMPTVGPSYPPSEGYENTMRTMPRHSVLPFRGTQRVVRRGGRMDETAFKTYTFFCMNTLGTELRLASPTERLASCVLRTRLKRTPCWSSARAHAKVDLNPAYRGIAGVVYARRGHLCFAQPRKGRRVPEAHGWRLVGGGAWRTGSAAGACRQSW